MTKIDTAKYVFNKRAVQWAEKYMDVSMYHEALDVFFGLLPQNASLLEIACGPGNLTKYLLQQRPDIRVIGLDIAPNMVELARVNNPAATFAVMDCRDINELTERYDAVMCGFALPYFSKTEATNLIGDVANLLEEGGAFYLSTMEGDYSRSGIQTSSYGDRVYMHYHPADYLVETLTSVGFQVNELRRVDIPGEETEGINDLIITAVLKRI